MGYYVLPIWKTQFIPLIYGLDIFPMFCFYFFFFFKKGNKFYIRYNNYWKLLLKKNDNKNYFLKIRYQKILPSQNLKCLKMIFKYIRLNLYFLHKIFYYYIKVYYFKNKKQKVYLNTKLILVFDLWYY